MLPDLNLLQDNFIKDLLQFTKSHQIKQNKQFPFWNLDRVLEMLSSSQFKALCVKNPSLYFKKVIFLVLLASPKRITEFKSISLSKSTITLDKIILRTHAKFIKKNATAFFNPTELPIPSYPNNTDICPVYNLNKYLEITQKISQNTDSLRPDQLFIKENGLPFTTHQLRSSIREIIIRADPLAPKESSTFHNVRKVASTLLDYRGFSYQQIMDSMQWKNSQTYLTYYCQLGLIEQNKRGCIIAGKVIPST